MSTLRWVFHDPGTGESYTVPINPNAMSSPYGTKRPTFVPGGVRAGLAGTRTTIAPPTPVEWEFSGRIRTKAHHDALSAWRKRGKIHITDHLERTFEVIPRSFEATERQPTKTNRDRYTYSFKALLLRQL